MTTIPPSSGNSAATEREARKIASIALGAIDATTYRFLDANEAYCAVVGRSLEELMRLRLTDITHPDDLPNHMDLFRQAIAGTIPGFVITKRYVRPDGSTVWARNSATLFRAENGAPDRFVALVRPVTGPEAPLSTAEGDDPVQTLRVLLGKKWTLDIITRLRQVEACRFNALLDEFPGMGSRILAERLTQLGAHGIVSRQQLATMPVHVSYSLTPYGVELYSRIMHLIEWMRMGRIGDPPFDRVDAE